jgi:hypothetical protein
MTANARKRREVYGGTPDIESSSMHDLDALVNLLVNIDRNSLIAILSVGESVARPRCAWARALRKPRHRHVVKVRIKLTGAADFGPQNDRRQVADSNPADTTRRLHRGINDAAVAVRRQQLQRLQPKRASDDNYGNPQ